MKKGCVAKKSSKKKGVLVKWTYEKNPLHLERFDDDGDSLKKKKTRRRRRN